MPRRYHNNNSRGRGQARGRGGGGGSHRGYADSAAPTTNPRHRYPHPQADIDVDVQQWIDPSPTPGSRGGGGNLNRGRGPWRGGTPASRSGAGTPSRGSGGSTPRGAGRGRGRGGRGRGQDIPARRPPHPGVGRGKAKPVLGRTGGKDAPLSDLLYAQRPLLRPVKFVRATLTPFLFQKSEDVLKSAAEVVLDTTDASHVPTANLVAELFRGRVVEESDSDSEADDVPDALEEVDFADLGEIRAEVDAIAQGMTTTTTMVSDTPAEEHIEEIDFADMAAMRAKVDAAQLQSPPQDVIIEEAFTGVYNQMKGAAKASSITDYNEANEPHVQDEQISTIDNSLHLEPSIDISNRSNRDLETALVEEETSSPLPLEDPSGSKPLELHPVPVFTNDTPLHPLAPHRDDDAHPLFIIDTTPTRPVNGRSASDVILVDRTGHGATLGDQDEEQIVYVAPHPRSGRASPIPAVPRVKLPPPMSVLTGRASGMGGLRSPVREDEALDGQGAPEEAPSFSLASLTHEPQTAPLELAATPAHSTRAARRVRKKEARRQRQRERQSKHHRWQFSAYGAMVSEARLREENAEERERPRWDTRRQGDSDVDWGTVDEDEEERKARDRADETDTGSDGQGMEIDPDLDLNLDAMQGFVKSMSVKGSQFVTMDDIEDEARLAREDEEGYGGPAESSASDDDEEDTDAEEEEAFQSEEERLIAESDGEAESDDDLSPASGFKTRLDKMRERGRSQEPKAAQERSDDEDEEDILAVISQRDIETFLDDLEFTTPVSKKKKDKKGKGKQTGEFALELEAQWTKDRAKKAEYKLARQQARLIAALDPLGAAAASGSGKNQGGGGTSRKAMRAAARLDPDKARMLAPHALVGLEDDSWETMVMIEDLLRRFVALGVPSVALPPMPKWVRKGVHEMAAEFGVGSKSKGSGRGRHTVLVRTRRTGEGVKEGRVKALVKRSAGGTGGRGGGGKGGRTPKQKDGDEVGKEAPKIGAGNIGFKMLASMGWSEGGRIGGSASVGIEAPLTAIIKNSKLGLGATR